MAVMKRVAPYHWIGVKKKRKGIRWNLSDAMVSLTPQELRTHALTIGATGCGKTTYLHHLIAQDILLGHSFAILDLRGDLVSAALELCAGRVEPERIALFDLRERERPLGFNPIAGSGEPYFRALGVLDVVASESESWGVQLAETLRSAVLLLTEAGESLPCLDALFFDSEYRCRILERITDESVKGFWLRYGELSKEKQSALALPVLNKVSLLFATKALRRTLSNPKPLDLGRHLNTPGSIILVSLAADELHGAGRMMGNLMLASICREVFARVGIPEKDRNPVRLYVDEFEHFTAKAFEHILAEGRRFGLTLVIAHQTLAQLSPRVRSMILNNVGVKAVFRTGREDGGTLSRDLTGDPKALNLPALPVGEAMLWRRGQDLLRIEVNAPLIPNVGTRSAEARSLIEQLHQAVPEFEEPIRHAPAAKSETPKKAKAAASAQSLEDWL